MHTYITLTINVIWRKGRRWRSSYSIGIRTCLGGQPPSAAPDPVARAGDTDDVLDLPQGGAQLPRRRSRRAPPPRPSVRLGWRRLLLRSRRRRLQLPGRRRRGVPRLPPRPRARLGCREPPPQRLLLFLLLLHAAASRPRGAVRFLRLADGAPGDGLATGLESCLPAAALAAAFQQSCCYSSRCRGSLRWLHLHGWLPLLCLRFCDLGRCSPFPCGPALRFFPFSSLSLLWGSHHALLSQLPWLLLSRYVQCESVCAHTLCSSWDACGQERGLRVCH